MSESWFKPDPNFKQLKERLQLRTTDGTIFTVHTEILRHSLVIKKLLDNAEEKNEDIEEPIKIPNTDEKTMIKILQFLAYHRFDPISDSDTENEDRKMSNWDIEYLKDVEPFILKLLVSAQQLEICRLVNIGSQRVANSIAGTSQEEYRIHNMEIFVRDLRKKESE